LVSHSFPVLSLISRFDALAQEGAQEGALAPQGAQEDALAPQGAPQDALQGAKKRGDDNPRLLSVVVVLKFGVIVVSMIGIIIGVVIG
jgi:hypothetical protein